MSFRNEDGILVPESSVPHFQLFFRNVPRSAGKRCAGKGAMTICRLGVPMQAPEATSGRDIREQGSDAKFGRAVGQGCRAATMIFLFYGLPAQTVCPSGDLAAEASLRGTPFGRDVPVWSDGLETARSTRSKESFRNESVAASAFCRVLQGIYSFSRDSSALYSHGAGHASAGYAAGA